MNEEIPETKVLSEEEEISRILENLPAETEVDVSVPSRGIPYFGKEGLLRVRPMTFEDEKSLSTGTRSPMFNPANHLISRCVSNVDIDKLLMIDKLFLLLKVRELSYGNEYKVGAVCTQCSYQNTLSLEIDKLNSIQVPKDFQFNNREVYLKGIKKKATVSYVTVADEEFLDPDKVSENLWRFVTSIDGIDTQTTISKVISKLPVVDIHILMSNLSLSEYGIQPQIRYACDSCSNSNLINLPIDENFFSVN
jgi:hypothetical protein